APRASSEPCSLTASPPGRWHSVSASGRACATRASRRSPDGTARACQVVSAAMTSRSRCELLHLADIVEVFQRSGGAEAAVEVARARRGTYFDPDVVPVVRSAEQ